MSKKLIAAAISVMSMSAAASFADGFDSPMFSVKGFGTAGIAHSSEDHADFVATPFQPKGVGHSHDWDMGVDSNLAVQLDANFTDRISAVVQVVSQYQYDNTWRPMIEWANVRYEVTPELSVRLGRIILPTFLFSESRKVGYANPWVRPPEEVYFASLTDNSDGGDLSYRKQFDGVVNTVQVFYGTSTGKYPTASLKAKPEWGINDTVEIDAWTLRAGYVSYKLDFKSRDLERLYGILNQFAAAAAASGYLAEAAQASALPDKYHLNGMHIGIYTLGANYDSGRWFATGEYVRVNGDSFIARHNNFYVTAGYRIAQLTPYVTLAQEKADRIKEAGISTANLPSAASLNVDVDSILRVAAASQRTASIGVRWDFMPGADFKIQCDQKILLNDTHGQLLLVPGTSYQGSNHFNVVSAAIDFVF